MAGYQEYEISYTDTREMKTHYVENGSSITGVGDNEFKDPLVFYASTEGTTTGSKKQVTLTLNSCPDMTDPEKWRFDESKTRITRLAGNKNVYNRYVYLNEATNVKQIMGYNQVNSYRYAFEAYPMQTSGPGLANTCNRRIGVLPEDEATAVYFASHGNGFGSMTIKYSIVQFDTDVSTGFNGNALAPFELTVEGVETWTKEQDYTYRYYLRQSATILAYLGIPATKESLNGLRLLYDLQKSVIRHNGEFTGEGASVENAKLDHEIEVSELRDPIINKGKEFNPFVYIETDWTEDGEKVEMYTADVRAINLAEDPLSNYKPEVTAYEVGDTIDLDRIQASALSGENAVITYSDGKTFPISQVISSVDSAMEVTVDGERKDGLRTLTIEPLKHYENLTITIKFYSQFEKIGTLAYQYSPRISEALPSSLKMTNVKTDFLYGDSYEYGDGAEGHLFDKDGNEIVIPSNSVDYLIEQGVITPDPSISSSKKITSTSTVYLDGKAGQGIITTTLENANFYKYLIFVSYCDSFRLSQTDLGEIYVDKNAETSLDGLFSSLSAQYSYHENTSQGSSAIQVSLSSEELAKSVSKITASSDGERSVVVSATPKECPKQSLSATAYFMVKINRVLSLEVETSGQGTFYYSGRNNKFQRPSDLRVYKVYNNPAKEKEELTGGEYSSIRFYLASGSTGESLVAAQSDVPPSAERIYAALTLDDGTRVEGSYPISYTEDYISSITVAKPFSFVLGSRLSKYRESGVLVLIAHYASGYETPSYGDVFDDYEFVQKADGEYIDYEKPIMSREELSTIYVNSGGDYYEIDTAGSITPIVPTGHLSIIGYQRTYQNGVDAIDFRQVSATITYDNTDDADTAVVATLDPGNVATASTYSLYCQGVSAFDGSEAFSLAMESGETQHKTISVQAKNRFDQSQTIDADIDVTVIDLDPEKITRIAVKSAKTSYKVGETFLNDSDTTLLDVYAGLSTPITVYLKDMERYFATDPAKGTAFTKTSDSTVVTVRLISDSTKYATYVIRVTAANYATSINTLNISTVLMPNGSLPSHPVFSKTHYYYDSDGRIDVRGYYILVDSSSTAISTDGSRVLDPALSFASVKIYGYLEDIFNAGANARVILFDDYVPPMAGESNITVTYPCYVEGNSDKIDKCHVAKLFGNSNASNRLFCSGNPDSPNCDWHSGSVNEYVQQGETTEANGDFTYFGDMDYCFYGHTDNEVMGYDIVASDKMIVLKSKSSLEPTNYFRTSGLMQAIDASGNTITGIGDTSLYMEAFPLVTGNIGYGAMNRNSIANLNGDTLYLSSSNTVCGLDIEGQVADSQRISYSRSRYIDPELREMDLSDASLWTDNKRLMLFTGECTYMTDYETLDSETMQYEWWKMDVKGIRCAANIEGTIYLGSSNGSLYRFERDRYYDCDKVFIDRGATLYVALDDEFSDGVIQYSEELNKQIDEDGDYKFTMAASKLQDYLFREIATVGPSSDLTIDYSKNALKLSCVSSDGSFDGERYGRLLGELGSGSKIYLNRAVGSLSIQGESPLNEYYRAYTLKPLDVDGGQYYSLIDADGNEVALSKTVTSGSATVQVKNLVACTICEPLDGEMDVIDLDKGQCTFRLSINGVRAKIVRYADQSLESASFPSELHKHTPVKSYFIAAPSILGSIGYRKTIWSWTVSAFKEANDLEICAASNQENLDTMKALALADKVPIGTDFKKASFGKIDFTKSVVPRKNTYIRPRTVPFMAFGFRSSRAENSILTAVSIVYSVPVMGWGRK